MSDNIDYSEYSLKELYEARVSVNRVKYPKNAEQIEKLIAEKEGTIPKKSIKTKIEKDPVKTKEPNPTFHTKKNNDINLLNFMFAIKAPIIVSTLASLFFTFLPYRIWIPYNSWISWLSLSVSILCTIWAGYLAYVLLDKSLLRASFAGPVLVFFSFFLIGFIKRLNTFPKEWVPPDLVVGTIFQSKFLITLFTIGSTYLLLFPITMLFALIGAKIAKKMPSNPRVNADC